VRDRLLERLPLLLGLTFVALAVGLGSVAIADGIRDRNRGDVITVTGSAKRRITSDYVIWWLSVTSQQPTTAAAATELARWTTRTRAFLESQGVRADELSVQPISTETLTGDSGEVTGYRLTRNLQLRSQRVQEVAQVAEASARLAAEGIPVAAQPLQYVYTKLPELRPELLADATRDAQNRARVLVEATGASLGSVRGVDVGVFQVTSPNSTEVSDYGIYDTSTLEKDVTAVVNVTFVLK
jgi:hypothetical protein